MRERRDAFASRVRGEYQDAIVAVPTGQAAIVEEL